MRRITRAAALAGAGILLARAIVPRLKLHDRLMAGCEGMFQQMPDDFPPKRIMHGIDEVRANTERTLQILEDLEERERGDEAEALGDLTPTEALAAS